YWSQQDNAFIVPDGNTDKFYVSGSTPINFFYFTKGVLTLNPVGDLFPGITVDTITDGSLSNGGATVSWDLQTARFDAGQISGMVFNVGGPIDIIAVTSQAAGVNSLTINQASQGVSTTEV